MSDQEYAPNTLGLLQQQQARPIDPEQLEIFGKKAAAVHQRGLGLSQSVVEVVKEARLSPEQIKRVCEFANTNAYLQEFEKAGDARNITFDGGPADPSFVIKELNDGSSPAIHQVQDESYAPPIGSYKTAGDQELAEAFGVSMQKAASVERDHFVRANPVDEVYDLYTRLDGLHEHFTSKLASSQNLLESVRSDLCDRAWQELQGGASFADIDGAFRASTNNPTMLKLAMEAISSHFRARGINDVQQVNSLKKTASGHLPNPEHPLIQAFVAFTKIAHEHRKLERAIGLVAEQRKTAGARLQRMV